MLSHVQHWNTDDLATLLTANNPVTVPIGVAVEEEISDIHMVLLAAAGSTPTVLPRFGYRIYDPANGPDDELVIQGDAEVVSFGQPMELSNPRGGAFRYRRPLLLELTLTSDVGAVAELGCFRIDLIYGGQERIDRPEGGATWQMGMVASPRLSGAS